MPKRLIMIASGGCAALVVLATCLLLIQSAHTGSQPAQQSPAALREMEAASPPPPPSEMVSPPTSVAAPPEAMAVSAPAGSEAPQLREPADGAAATDPIAVSVPQLAYAYQLAYRLPGPRIAEAQQAHLTLCQKLGPTRCQLVSMRNGSSDEGYKDAALQLRVASGIAQRFRGDLTQAIADAGGRPVDTSITAEDVSKDMVDTEARIRQREILVARLTEMLRSRQGRVSELVEAERSVAAAQEELDQAKGWLGQLRTRVALSQFRINYVPAVAVEPSPRPQSNRLADAFVTSLGAVFALGRTLLILLILLAPWAAIGLAIALPLRRWYKRRYYPAAEA
ncbi:hypothetical protein FHS95_000671 [Sphingomonas naasensis]|nr:DUF4349 domain-containing protein [Sphingomonas naasensis]NIJ19002.1 hypothetical protein [Sphingomonas naasensis]